MNKSQLAKIISEPDQQTFKRLMLSKDLRSSQEAIFDLYESYIGVKIDRSCGKCRSKTIYKIKEIIQMF